MIIRYMALAFALLAAPAFAAGNGAPHNSDSSTAAKSGAVTPAPAAPATAAPAPAAPAAKDTNVAPAPAPAAKEAPAADAKAKEEPKVKDEPYVALRAAILGCLEGAGKAQVASVTKLGMDEGSGGSDFVVGYECADAPAQALFEKLGTSSEDKMEDKEAQKLTLIRTLGEESEGPSACFREIRTAGGAETNKYRCFIRVDIDKEIVKKLAGS